jgi:uncharacterized membrane protein YGL010W
MGYVYGLILAILTIFVVGWLLDFVHHSHTWF